MERLLAIAAAALALGIMGIWSTAALSPVAAQSTTAEVAATQTFAIENMTCALCPVTVKTAMERVEGVQGVEVDFEAKTATVVFDPAVTSLEAIAAASTNAGYPATAQS